MRLGSTPLSGFSSDTPASLLYGTFSGVFLLRCRRLKRERRSVFKKPSISRFGVTLRVVFYPGKAQIWPILAVGNTSENKILIRINLWNHVQRETLMQFKTLKWITGLQEPGLCSTHWVKSCLLYLQATCSNQMKAGAHKHAVVTVYYFKQWSTVCLQFDWQLKSHLCTVTRQVIQLV